MVSYVIEGCKPERKLVLAMEYSGNEVLITATGYDNIKWYIARFTSDGCLRLAKSISDTTGLALDDEHRITIVD